MHIMEKKTIFQNSKGLKLVGIIHNIPKNQTKSAVIIAHGSTANKDRERLVGLAQSLNESAIGVLRFDFGGCGESEDREITIGGQVDDLKSAIGFLRKQVD
jgi:alpha/beta superfamily hydrolase